MDNEIILKKIESMAQDAGWSFYKLSKRSGIAQSTLSSIFTSRSNISLANLDRICKAFGVTLGSFFGDLEKKESQHSDMELADEFPALNERDRRLLKTMMAAMQELNREKKGYGDVHE